MVYRKHNVVILIAFFILSLLFVFPFAKTGTVFFGDDMYYHLQRINELAMNIKQGNWFIGIYTYSFGKIGYPLNMFYPWITLLPFALIKVITNSTFYAAYLGISFYTFLNLTFVYWTTLKLTNQKIQSLITAIIYSFCSYRVIDIFARFALGEFIALTFIPLCFYGLYAIIIGNEKDWTFLAAGVSLILLTHILSTIIVFVFLIAFLLIFLLFWKIEDIRARLFAMIKAVLFAILGSAIFVIPFLEQELFQKFAQPSKMNMVNTAVLPSQLISQSLDNNLLKGSAGNTYNIGIILLIVLIIGLIQYRKWNKLYKAIYFVGITFLLMSTNLVPWSILQKTPLTFIQFPWRFLGLSSYLLSIIGGYELSNIRISNSKLGKISIVGSIILVLLLPWYSSVNRVTAYIFDHPQTPDYWLFTLRKNHFSTLIKSEDEIFKYYYPEQYTPKGGEYRLNLVEHHEAIISNEKVMIKDISFKPNRITFQSKSFTSAHNVILPMYAYKNLKVIDKNVKPLRYTVTKDRLINVKNSRHNNVISVYYAMSFVDKLSVTLSIMSWIYLLIIRFLIKLFKRSKNFNATVSVR